MATITDYVQLETREFTVYPFNEADALVYALLSYGPIPQEIPLLAHIEQQYGTLGRRIRAFDWQHPIQSTRVLREVPYEGVRLRDLEHYQEFDKSIHELDRNEPTFVSEDVTEKFYKDTALNPRFAVTQASAVEMKFQTERAAQFAALTYRLPDGTLVVTYRGTDDTLVGWREDLDMSYSYPVPAQRMAADYLERVAKLWNGPIILTGHSKGGNLAVYAAMNVSERTQNRIERIFSLDGPGFPPTVAASREYAAIVDRVTKVMPDSSIIGQLLITPQREHRIIVRSNVTGLMQHSGFTWLMLGDHFDTVPSLTPSSKQFYEQINTWLQTHEPAHIERGVDALFQVLGASGNTKPSQITSAGFTILPDMLTQFAGLDSEDRRTIMQVMRLIAGAALAKNPEIERS
ncbi:alpha/beta hydrolase [Bifidobacterium dolichotidis]|uniref:Alpha/beta hydrolase n=1 Tax=Bifidobacterium dolichotidis TaxID=2306976 RepID=A0A430FQM5_9BIFI|nr:DUF2974 domain-containing protein [Bifidobacterium dolichotidis]RSX55116.1 alpha/beta hydrolase [Bifidobacterium dolichotidis]